MADQNIFHEIDEELRSDRMRSFWRRFGPWIILAAVLVVLAVGANEGYKWWSRSNSDKSSDLLYQAFAEADAGKLDEAQTTLTDLAQSGTGGYPMLARFKQASLLAKQGKTDEALAAYDKLSSDQSNSDIRSLALLMGANLLVDKGDVGGVETRVGGLLATNNPLRNSAREALGLANYKAGKLEEARKQFQAVIDDPLSPADMRARMQVYIDELTAEGVKPPAQPAAAETSTPAKAGEQAPGGAAAPAEPAQPAAPAPAQPAAPAPSGG